MNGNDTYILLMQSVVFHYYDCLSWPVQHLQPHARPTTAQTQAMRSVCLVMTRAHIAAPMNPQCSPLDLQTHHGMGDTADDWAGRLHAGLKRVRTGNTKKLPRRRHVASDATASSTTPYSPTRTPNPTPAPTFTSVLALPIVEAAAAAAAAAFVAAHVRDGGGGSRGDTVVRSPPSSR
jgi:hypothetical protein